VARWAELVKVLMNCVKRYVFRRRLKVSVAQERLIPRDNPFETVGTKQVKDHV